MAHQNYKDELGDLIGEKREPIRSDLLFTYKDFEPLRIRSGANSIKWNYILNTQSTPTVGGEVVQILSCAVGPITIEGMAAGYETNTNPRSYQPVGGYGQNGLTPVDEMTRIIQWFLNYMHRSGTQTHRYEKRDEAAIHMMYAARGWDFWIQVTSLNGLDIHNKQVGVPWSITAEIVNDPARDYLSVDVMNDFTDSITSRRALHQITGENQQFAKNPFVNPQLEGFQLDIQELATRLGDNFQALVAAWAGGDFPQYGLSSPLSDPGAQTGVTNPYDVYWPTLGGEYIGDVPLSDYGQPYYGGSGAGSQALDPSGDGVSYFGENLKKWIVCKSRELKLDPAAVLAGVSVEGGFSGAVGDNGTSFGPWQLHGGVTINDPKTAGKLPQTVWDKGPAHAKFWVNSELGLTYAINSLAAAAAGLTGTAALTAIANWEGSNNIPGQIAKSQGKYQTYKDFADGVDCTQPILPAPTLVGGIFKPTGPTTADGVYWGGSKEVADKLLAIAKKAVPGISYSGKRSQCSIDGKGGSMSDHYDKNYIGFAWDITGTEAQLDAVANALVAAMGETWNFQQHSYDGNWFNTTKNTFRVQVGWRQKNHGPGDNMHVHMGVRASDGKSLSCGGII